MDQRTEGRRAGVLSATVVLGLFALLLVVGHRFLPMNDAPSHIANGVIAHKLLAGDPFFSSHYRFDLVAVPYWATALLLVLLQKLVTPLVAWRVIIGLYLVLLPLSLGVLWWAMQPDAAPTDKAPRPALPPLLPLCGLTVFHWGYWMGESNYLLGQPVALLALALLIRSRRLASPSFVGFVLLAALSYLCHIYALTLLLIAATAWAFLALCAHKVPGLGAHKLRPVQALGLCLVYALFAVAVYFVLFQHGSDANRGSLGFDLSLRRLAHMLVDPFDSPQPSPRLTLLGLYGGLFAVFAFAHRQTLRQLVTEKTDRLVRLFELFEPGLLFPGLLVLLAAYLGPVSILAADGTQKEGEIAIRFVLGGFLLSSLSLKLPARPGRNLPLLAVLTLTAIFSASQLASAHRIHASVDEKIQRIDAALLAKIPPHSRVLPLLDLPGAEWRDYLVHRIGNYVVLRDSYSPHVFAVRGQHALRHLPWGDQREVANLHVTEEEWRFYDYVLRQSQHPPPAELSGHLQLVATQDDFQLWQVRRP